MRTVDVLERLHDGIEEETSPSPSELSIAQMAALVESAAWARIGEWLKASPPYFPRRVVFSAMTKLYVAADAQDIYAEAPTVVELSKLLEGK